MLQDMHQRDTRHGKVSPEHVLLRDDGLELVPPSQSFWRDCTADRDVRGFGAMLYEIVTGTAAPEEYVEANAVPAAPGGDCLEPIRAAAIRLAHKCMGHLSTKTNMRQAAMEVRLLYLHAQRIQARENAERKAPVALIRVESTPVAAPEPSAPDRMFAKAAEVA